MRDLPAKRSIRMPTRLSILFLCTPINAAAIGGTGGGGIQLNNREAFRLGGIIPPDSISAIVSRIERRRPIVVAGLDGGVKPWSNREEPLEFASERARKTIAIA